MCKTRADVLNIKHERVEIFHLLRLRTARLAVQRIDWQAGAFVFRI